MDNRTRKTTQTDRRIGRRTFMTLSAGVAATVAGVGARSRYALAQSSGKTELDALVKAAQAEGEVVFYASQTDNVTRRVCDAFTAKYGIKTKFARLDGGPLAQRYSTEAETNSYAVDFFTLAGGADKFGELALSKGWIESINDAKLPVVVSGEFPAKFNRGRAAIIQLSPWLLAYNTDKVKKDDLPKDWTGLLDARWKDQVILSDPGISDSYVDFWVVILEKYGESFLTGLRDRVRKSGQPMVAIQSLGASEGFFYLPVVTAQVEGVKAKGSPIDAIQFDYTGGIQMQVMLAPRAKAPHPNAGRLFANYVMSAEGNAVFNADPGAFTMYDTAKLPKEYVPPRPETAARRSEIMKLLGYA